MRISGEASTAITQRCRENIGESLYSATTGSPVILQYQSEPIVAAGNSNEKNCGVNTGSDPVRSGSLTRDSAVTITQFVPYFGLEDMATRPVLSDEQASEGAVQLFDEIRRVRETDFVNNFWRTLGNDPGHAANLWQRLQDVMQPGALDPLTKELIYIAVSVANSCTYCAHSHTAAAKARGMTDEQHSELLQVIAMASETNALANCLQVPVDECFEAG